MAERAGLSLGNRKDRFSRVTQFRVFLLVEKISQTSYFITAVMMAARSLIVLYRKVNPELLHRKDKVCSFLSLRNIAFPWLASSFMQQVACGFMQLVAAGCMLNIQHFYSLFEGKSY